MELVKVKPQRISRADERQPHRQQIRHLAKHRLPCDRSRLVTTVQNAKDRMLHLGYSPLPAATSPGPSPDPASSAAVDGETGKIARVADARATPSRRPLVRLRPILLTLLLLGSFAPAASAFTISNFRVHATSSRVHWALTVCGAKGRHAHLEVVLFPDSGPGVEYTRNANYFVQFDCTRLSFSTQNIWTSELWDTRATVTVGDSTRRTHYKTFYMP